ncbi:MAG: carboxy terminal-processing peptidase [Gammaproteobacteria bacterium]
MTSAPIAPTADHAKLDKIIANLLTDYHYRQSEVSDKQSSAILDAYLEALDFNRSVFLASDIKSFEKYRYNLDDALKAGDLGPAYEIFNLYRQRLAERTARLKTQLQGDINFDVDESVELDRNDKPWVENRIDLDEIWRKRLKSELLQLILAGQNVESAHQTLVKRYEGRLRHISQYTSEDVFQTYMNAVATSFDPHTAYFSPRATENFNIQMRLSLEGIGTVLRMEEEQINVIELVPGGPAALSGQLAPNDKIVGVAQGDNGPMVDVIGWRLDDVVDLIRGQRGTVVRLEVTKNGSEGATKTIRLVRDTIKLEKQAARSEVKTVTGPQGASRIGVITIPTFYSDFAAAQRGDDEYRSTTRDVRRILTDLKKQGVDGVLVDLRQNGGGSLQEAVELTGLFIPNGPVVQVRNARGSIKVETDPDPSLVYDGPLAILVDRFSASASEIFASALQDYGRAIVLGDPTFGKGTVQTLVDLGRFVPNAKNALGQLKITIAKFYRINGSSTQHRGVTPDITFPSAVDNKEVGESAQHFALPWDEIKSASFKYSGRLANLLPELMRRHNQRIANDPLYKVLLEEIAAVKQAQAKKNLSLLETQRRVERTQAEQQQLTLENHYRLAAGLKPLKAGESIPTDEEKPDPVLGESVHIVADLAGIDKADGRTVVAVDPHGE